MWHGDADNLVPLSHAEWMADIIPDCELQMDPGEGHLGGLLLASRTSSTRSRTSGRTVPGRAATSTSDPPRRQLSSDG